MYSTDKHITENKSTTLIVSNECYELLYSNVNNRIYLTIKGFWKSRSKVPDFIPDLKKALKLAQTDFTLMADLRTMITHPQSVMSLHVEGYVLLKNAGMKKGANVEPDDRIATLQIEDTISQSDIPLKRFTSYTEAEEWLNAK